jgi:replicative DNA helicase
MVMEKMKIIKPEDVEGEEEEETIKSNLDKNHGHTEILPGDQQTIEMEQDASKTINRVATSADKTMLMFGAADIKKKISDEITDIPEAFTDELEQEYLSSLIKSPFPNRTEADQLKINRNFLRDAEPFHIDRLMGELQNTPKELQTGFDSLDKWIRIPQHKIILIASRPGHGKTAFMLNMMLNMSRLYNDKHFLYFSYGEPRRDIELKLINMSGDMPFTDMAGLNSNFERWKFEFKHQDANSLKKKAEEEKEYRGLNKFLEVSTRIHVIDSNYNIADLIDSIEAFQRTLTVGGVFIDYLQAIRPAKDQLPLPRRQQLQDITDQLRELGNETSFPIIVGGQFSVGDPNAPEYDNLSTGRLKDTGDPEQAASLIIGLQNYAKSNYIGSNINNMFKSHFYTDVFKKADKMPETFKDKHAHTVILAKVLANQGRPEPEVELIFNKWLMKISDLKDGSFKSES